MTAPSDGLEQRFQDALRALGVSHARLLVAVSGGADSVALLELLDRSASALGLALVVAHVDHGIAADSATVAGLVAAHAARLALPFVTERLELGADAGETLARTRRWSALERMRSATMAELIVTAHHRDDQAETVLMRVLRGTGPAGLAGMQERTASILRPLLPFRRDELARYVHERDLIHWTDPSNASERHDRAWIRQRLVPLLQQRWPDVIGHLNRVSADADRWRRAWADVISLLPELDLRQERDAISVAGGVLAGYSSETARAVVRALGLRAGVVMSHHGATRALELAARGRSGSWVPLGGDWRAAMAFGRLRIERPAEVPAPVTISPRPGVLQWGEWTFRATHDKAPAMHDRQAMRAWLPLESALVRTRQPGDRMQPLGGTGHRSIARLMQAARVPLGRRPLWPVVVLEGAPVWIPGVCRSHGLVPQPGTEALRIDAEHR